MMKVIVRKQKAAHAKGGFSKRGKIKITRVSDGLGGKRTLRKLDITSPTFSSDLTYAFSKNVEKARKENRQVTGVSDGVVPSR